MRGRWLGGVMCLVVFSGACGSDDGAATNAERQLAAAEAEGNRAPVIEGIHFEPARPVAGDRVEAVVRARDPDGDPLELAHLWEVGGRRVPADGGSLDLPAWVSRGDPIAVQVVASDGRSESGPHEAETEAGNRPPELAGVRLEPATEVGPGERVTAVVDASDPDGDPVEVSVTWRVNRRPVQQDGRSFVAEGLRRGDAIDARIVVSDGDDRLPAVESPVVRVANRPPTVESQPEGVGPGGVLRYAIEARDPDGDRNLRFRLREGPEGMTVDPVLGEVLWRPRPDQAGKHPVEIVVEDAEGASVVHAFELTVALEEEAPPPAAPAAP